MFDIAIRCYGAAIAFGGLFDEKAQKWRAGRRGQWQKMARLHFEQRPVWFHCASLGEYLQGKPLIEALREKHPEIPVVVSFFSPSGFENFKDHHLVSACLYLPLDTPKNARGWVQRLHPAAAVFVKYEFWPNYLRALQKREVPTMVASARFRPGQFLFSLAGKGILSRLKKLEAIAVQDEASMKLLQERGFKNVHLCGDTRFDNVLSNRNNPKEIEHIETFADGQPLFVCGSTWPEDEAVIMPQIMKFTRYKFVFAPHDVSPKNVARLQAEIPIPSVRYSEISNETLLSEIRVLIIDRIGLLNQLYGYGAVAFVGGGYGRGLHNILEPAAFGLAVFYGNNFSKNPEAKELENAGGGKAIADAAALTEVLQNFQNHAAQLTAFQKSSEVFVLRNAGATECNLRLLLKHLNHIES